MSAEEKQVKKPKRKAMSKKLRFEVFKRDNFKCQYCGKCAPDVVLHVDHIDPVSKGGKNEIMNLITACEDCNGGKSDRLLSDQSVMAKQRAQLEQLNARREQLEQMLAWRKGLEKVDKLEEQAAIDACNKLGECWLLTPPGEADVGKWVQKFGLNAVLDAIDVAKKYVVRAADGKPTRESVIEASRKIPNIARMSLEPDWKRQLHYIRGIARNRFNYVNESECLHMLERAYHAGASIDALKSVVFGASSWTAWCNDMSYFEGV